MVGTYRCKACCKLLAVIFADASSINSRTSGNDFSIANGISVINAFTCLIKRQSIA